MPFIFFLLLLVAGPALWAQEEIAPVEKTYEINWDTLYRQVGLNEAQLIEEEQWYNDLVYQRWQRGDSTVLLHRVQYDEYLLVVREGDRLLTRGLLAPGPEKLIDSLTAYNPTDFSATRYHIYATQLVPSGEWLETTAREEVRSGPYQQGQRHGWWAFEEPAGSYTARFERDSLIGYGQVEGLPRIMVEALLRGRWLLVRQNQTGTIDQTGQYQLQGQHWFLQRQETEYWQAALDLQDGHCQYDAAPTGSPYFSGLYTWRLEPDHTLVFNFREEAESRATITFLSERELQLKFE